MNKKAVIDTDLLIFFWILFFSVTVILAIRIIKINYFDNIPSVVMVDGKEVYSGTSAGFDTESNGYATKVIIKGGFLYLFPQKVYVSKDVVVKGEK